jgi:hypothetical protein
LLVDEAKRPLATYVCSFWEIRPYWLRLRSNSMHCLIRHRLLLVSFAVLFFFGFELSAIAQIPKSKCDWAQFERDAAEMRAARDAAMKIVVQDGETDVAPEAIKQIQAFKNGLFASYKDFFLCQSMDLPQAGQLETTLYTKLGLPKPKPNAADSQPDNRSWTGLYLTEVEIKVEVVPDNRKLVAIRTNFEIPYGNDAEVDIFEPKGGAKWTNSLHFTSRPYATIAQAFSAFDYRISPADESGKWFVVTTYVNPWPTSCWQSLTIDALRPEEYFVPTSIFHDTLYGYICDDTPPYLRQVSKDGFQVQFSLNSMDGGALSSTSFMNYRVHGDEVNRLQPVASNVVNFVDEWTRRSWEQARDWSVMGNLNALHQAHIKVHSGLFGEFFDLRICSSSSEEQVGFTQDGKDGADGASWYFLIKHVGDAYSMVRVSNRPDSSCKGRNRLASIKDKEK